MKLSELQKVYQKYSVYTIHADFCIRYNEGGWIRKMSSH